MIHNWGFYVLTVQSTALQLVNLEVFGRFLSQGVINVLKYLGIMNKLFQPS